jgi:addiction module HigA family antidote
MSNVKVEYKNIIAFHPGHYVKELIEDMEITQSELAKRMDTTDKTVSKLLSGEIPLSMELAKKLSQMTGVSVGTWLNLQKVYNEKCCKIDWNKKIDKEIEYLENIDYSYFVQLGVVPETKDKEIQVQQLLQYLKLSSLKVLQNTNLLVACKTSVPAVNRKNVMNANAWIQTGLNFSRNIECADFDKQKLKESLVYLRQLTSLSFDVFYPRLKHILAGCGVAFVALPYLKNSGLNGADRWISHRKVLLLINDRRKDNGTFWFALFHEIRHIMEERKKRLYITPRQKNMDVLSLGRNNADEECEADLFARNYLIPPAEYKKFEEEGDFDEEAIRKFSKQIGIDESIVLGRLQYDGKIQWKYNGGLRKKNIIR